MHEIIDVNGVGTVLAKALSLATWGIRTAYGSIRRIDWTSARVGPTLATSTGKPLEGSPGETGLTTHLGKSRL